MLCPTHKRDVNHSPGMGRRDAANDRLIVEKAFFDIYEEGDWICSGGCPKGGDRFAERIAKENGIPILIFFPNWEKYGKRAGFVRNNDIAENCDVLIACVSDDRRGGTEDTIKKFNNRLETIIV